MEVISQPFRGVIIVGSCLSSASPCPSCPSSPRPHEQTTLSAATQPKIRTSQTVDLSSSAIVYTTHMIQPPLNMRIARQNFCLCGLAPHVEPYPLTAPGPAYIIMQLYVTLPRIREGHGAQNSVRVSRLPSCSRYFNLNSPQLV